MRGVLLTLKLDKQHGYINEEKAKAAEATRIRKFTQEPPAYTLGSVFAGLIPKRNILGLLALGGKLLRISWIYTKQRYVNFMLALYGYSDLRKFVSNRVINTFKWLPGRADKHEKFLRYLAFINKAYKKPQLEIEIRYKDDNSE